MHNICTFENVIHDLQLQLLLMIYINYAENTGCTPLPLGLMPCRAEGASCVLAAAGCLKLQAQSKSEMCLLHALCTYVVQRLKQQS